MHDGDADTDMWVFLIYCTYRCKIWVDQEIFCLSIFPFILLQVLRWFDHFQKSYPVSIIHNPNGLFYGLS